MERELEAKLKMYLVVKFSELIHEEMNSLVAEHKISYHDSARLVECALDLILVSHRKSHRPSHD